MKNIILNILFFLTFNVYAKSIIDCFFREDEINVEFSCVSGKLCKIIYSKSNNQKKLICNLKKDYFINGEKHVYPNLSGKFSYLDCEGDLLPYLKPLLLENLYINITRLNQNVPLFKIQWHKNHQPKECSLKYFDYNKLKKI